MSFPAASHSVAPTKQAKSVRFSDSPPETFFVDRKTDEEVSMSWYSPDEYSIFRTDCKYIIQAANEMMLDYISEDSAITRGLERYINAPESTQQYQRASVQVVLIEQKRQRNRCIHNPEVIGRMSMVVTNRARLLARNMAVMDAEQACNTYNEVSVVDENAKEDWQTPGHLIRVYSA